MTEMTDTPFSDTQPADPAVAAPTPPLVAPPYIRRVRESAAGEPAGAGTAADDAAVLRRDWTQLVLDEVREHPFFALAAALGVGAAIGRITR